jgi:LysM repeat protein
MKIVRIFGVVLALHVVGGILFIQPGCQSQPRPETTSTIPAIGEPVEMLDWENWEQEDSLVANDRPRTAPTRPAAESRPIPSGESTLLLPLAPLEPLPSTRPSDPTGSQASSITYTVRGGDSLWSIANRNNISLPALLSANGLTESSVIQPGQELRIPGGTTGGRPATTASSPASTELPTATTTYTVRSGDSLSIIARRHNTTVPDLKALNNMTSDMIRIDQKLIVPAGSAGGARPASSTSTPRSTATPTSGGRTHTVQAGETPGGIASKYGVSVSELMNLNGISDPRRMRLGQTLNIPGTEPAPAARSTVSGPTPAAATPSAPPATSPSPAPSQSVRSLSPRDIPVLPAEDGDEDQFPIIPIIPANR